MKRHCSLTLALALLNLLLAAPILAAPAAGRLPLLIEDTTGTDRQAEPVTTGVPFVKGRFRDVRGLTAVDAAGSPIPCQFTRISSWPDRSVRWALLDCQVDVKANGSTKIGIQRGQAAPPARPVKITDTEGRQRVDGPLAVHDQQEGLHDTSSGILVPPTRIRGCQNQPDFTLVCSCCLSSGNQGGTIMRFASRLFVIVCWCASGHVLAADEPAVVELWPGKVPDEAGNIGPEKVVISPALDRKQVEVTESTRMVTNVSRPTITIYRPARDKDTKTAALICPGGGYWNLHWQLEGEEVAAWLNSLGITGIILKYRVPRRPDEPKGEPARRPLQDAQRAVSLVRSRAKQWGVDPQQIGMVGFSAGGHLALATATGFQQRTYEPVDDSDKTSCRPDFAVLCYSGYLKAKDKDELAPGLRIPTGTPPIFLAHGGDDIISDPRHSVVAYLALKQAGVPAELHVYATAAHDFGVRPSDRPCSTWTRSCAAWLRHQGLLKPPASDH